jgi:putative IMPACT (imprinted ancient) family translation regulator
MPTTKTLSLDLGAVDFPHTFVQHHHCIEDRGSLYSATVGRVTNRADIAALRARTQADPRYTTATHHSFAARIEHDGVMYETKEDDGEVGAGQVILRELHKVNIKNCCVIITRWYGGTKLENDRYAHIQNAVQLTVLSCK